MGAILLHRSGDKGAKRGKILHWSWIALVLVLADIIIKWALAGTYQQALMGVLGG
jgi:hypothetical protein